ncbi:MAG: hypothetical protein ACFBZ8_01335 [Opitutales bacterium]
MNHPAFQTAVAELERIVNDPAFSRLRSRSASELSAEEKALLERANVQADEVSRLRESAHRQRTPYYLG